MISITLGYPPSANKYWRNWKNRTLLSAEGRAYKAATALKAKKLEPLKGPVCVQLAIYRPRKAGDLDNRIKPVLDALNGYAFEDDDQVTQIIAVRRDDKDSPRVEVQVWEAK